MYITPRLFDPLTTLISIFQVDARYHCNASMAVEPHVFTEKLGLALETLWIMSPTEVDVVIQNWLGGEGDTTIPTGKDLEGAVIRKSYARLDICIIREEGLRLFPRTLRIYVEKGVSGKCSYWVIALVRSHNRNQSRNN